VAAKKKAGRRSAERPDKREGSSWDWVFAPRKRGDLVQQFTLFRIWFSRSAY
jgi:hypothetical protein